MPVWRHHTRTDTRTGMHVHTHTHRDTQCHTVVLGKYAPIDDARVHTYMSNAGYTHTQ
jgi:hypothetical protein